ncbi:hypothetical protein BGZ72_009847 [Mortierella alpina]|nr:hypothetical protein BGZ72_009847 [Mortierella alpina]
MPYRHAPPQKDIPDPDTPLALVHPTHLSAAAPRSPHQQQHQHQSHRQSRLTLMSLPDECLAILIHWVANQGVQDLYPLLCVNKRIFYHVVPILYRDPFRLSARWVWKRSVYKGVIERQTKLIRTLLLCCTRTITKITPIDDGSTTTHNDASSTKLWSGTYVAKAIAAAKGKRRGDKGADTAARIGSVLSSPPQTQPQLQRRQQQQQHQQHQHQQQQQQLQHRQQQGHAHASVRENRKLGSATTATTALSSSGSSGRTIPGPTFLESVGSSDEITEQVNTNTTTTTATTNEDNDGVAVQNTHPRSRLHALLHKLGSIDPSTSIKDTAGKAKASLQNTHLQEIDQQRQLWPQRLFRNRHHQQRHYQQNQQQQQPQQQQQQRPQPTTVERIPIVWDADSGQSEQQRIPGLGRPIDNGKFFPPELAKTILRLADEPAPMVNYLSYVTHTDVRSWSAASNMTLVHQILGDARLSWHVRLQILLNRTSRRIRGQQPASSNHTRGGARTHNGFGAGAGSTFINRLATHEDLDDGDDLDDDIMEANFIRRRGRYRRWRRDKRNKNLWGTADVNFVELLFLFYTSKRMESLSLGMNCSHWYHPSLDVLLPDIPERLSGLRRIVIDHADTIIPNAVPVPQLFIQRHQKAFPGQLREIQVRQSYHYSYDMSRSVLETIQRMDRLEVLDLSIWTGVFSGLDSIRTDHLRKLLICHHMDVPKPEVFDALLQRCLVLEELSIIVPHPKLFAWAVERRREATAGSSSASTSSSSSAAGAVAALTPFRRRPPPQHLPPLRIVTFFGHTPDVAGAFKDVMYAFQDTLESVQASMYPDLTKSGGSHFEVPVPHFAMPPDADENAPLPSTSTAAFFGIGILQDPLLQPTTTTTTTTDTPTNLYGAQIPSMIPLPWQDGGDHSSAAAAPSSSSSSSQASSATAARTSTLLGPVGPSPLTWDWPLPRLRTMSLRGPIVAHFDLGLLRFCPQLTDLALSYHCSRLPRLAYPAPSPAPQPSTSSVDSSSSSSVNSRSPSASSQSNTSSSFPIIMVCESLAFKWGLTLQDERRSLVIL